MKTFLGIAVLIVSATMFIGCEANVNISTNDSGSGTTTASGATLVSWDGTTDEMNELIKSGSPVVLDFYADW